MMELITTLLQAVITVAVPVLSTFAVKWLQTKTDQAVAETENEKTKSYLQAASDAVSTAVAYTSQTYVDALKDSDTFTAENQAKALSIALDKTKLLLTQDAKSLLVSLYNDLDEWLTTKIEQAVQEQKHAA